MQEVSFHQAFSKELESARVLIEKFKASGMKNTNDLNQAWDLYYHVFRRINKQLPQLTMLELQYVSPRLLNARNLELAVPGTYRVDRTAVRIAMFGPNVQVITSKQPAHMRREYRW